MQAAKISERIKLSLVSYNKYWEIKLGKRVLTVNMQLSPPTTRDVISGWCWIQIAVDPKNCFMHWTFCTFRVQVEWELELRELLCCKSPSFSMTSVADWKATLSSSERLSMYSWIAFWNASFLTSTELVGGWGSKDWSSVACTSPARVLALDPAITLLSIAVSGEAGLRIEMGLALRLFDLLWRNGVFNNSPNFWTLSLVLLLSLILSEDILYWNVNRRTPIINHTRCLYQKGL